MIDKQQNPPDFVQNWLDVTSIIIGGDAELLVAAVKGASKTVGKEAAEELLEAGLARVVKKKAKNGASGGPRSRKRFPRKGKADIDAENARSHDGVNVCENCGIEMHPGQRTVRGAKRPPDERQRDHIIPRSRGGDGDPSNGQLLCRTCNQRKGTKMP